uniref:Uncharacterized protein n=1 Tax=Rhipicephalus microplus TaxID=6941 RepID=A0A6G5AHI0_RHIMP
MVLMCSFLAATECDYIDKFSLLLIIIIEMLCLILHFDSCICPYSDFGSFAITLEISSLFYIHKVISTLHNSEISFEEDVLNNRRFRNSPILAVHCTLVLLCPVDQFYNNAALKHC